jgi:type II secretory pathway component PulC
MRMRTAIVLVLAPIVACVALTGCGSSPPPRAATPAPQAKLPPASAPVPEAPPSATLTRSAVHRAVTQGLGAFLQHVMVDERPVMEGGKFKGFRIVALEGSMFQNVDLKPGDVVMRVNGFPIEHPEQALEAFRSLDVASELRVDYEREGKPRELRFGIVEDGTIIGPPAASTNLRSR